MRSIVCILSLIVFLKAQAHEGEKHKSDMSVGSKSSVESARSKEVYTRINEAYIANIKPIFQQSCFNCHSNQTNYPWYAKLPGAKQLIDADVTEAKRHLDFTADFPFGSHSSPPEDLVAIEKSIGDSSMPPLRYRVMHPGSKLSSEEILKVEKWVDESLVQLRTLTP